MNASPRALSFSVGLLCGGAALVAMQRTVWSQAAEVCGLYGYVPSTAASSAHPVDNSVWGPRTRAYLAQSWNRGVDNTLGALSAELARRGL